MTKVRRNLAAKLPETAPLFEEFLCAVSVEIQRPTAHDRQRAREFADTKDVPIRAAAIGAGARLLVTHNIKHFRSGQGVRVVRPRRLIEEARAWMSSLGTQGRMGRCRRTAQSGALTASYSPPEALPALPPRRR